MIKSWLGLVRNGRPNTGLNLRYMQSLGRDATGHFLEKISKGNSGRQIINIWELPYLPGSNVSCVRQCFSDHHGPHKPGEAKAVQVSWPPGPAGELGLKSHTFLCSASFRFWCQATFISTTVLQTYCFYSRLTVITSGIKVKLHFIQNDL